MAFVVLDMTVLSRMGHTVLGYSPLLLLPLIPAALYSLLVLIALSPLGIFLAARGRLVQLWALPVSAISALIASVPLCGILYRIGCPFIEINQLATWGTAMSLWFVCTVAAFMSVARLNGRDDG